MPMQSALDFRAVLAKSGLLEDSVLDGLFAAETPGSSTDAAKRLLNEGLLTEFQAKMLLAGRHRGLLLGPYRVLDQLGRGGMGIVFLAEHQKLHRRVALKILPHKSMKEPLALERFYREARAVAALDHPNIVKAYDVGEQDGIHFLAMEYVKGVNLQTHLDTKGPMPWRAAAGFIAQACKGLEHAHERGLVHRDIKPGNLLVDRRNTVKILDLGLARCFQSSEDNVTAKFAPNDELTGSIDFMAPEVARGEQNIDIRADIYSLGLTFHAFVLGKSPYEGTPAQKLLSHQVKPLTPLHEAQPAVPPELSAVVARMTEKEPEQRYPTPTAVLVALAPWLPASAAPPSTIRISASKTAVHTPAAPRPTEPVKRVTKPGPETLPQALPEEDELPAAVPVTNGVAKAIKPLDPELNGATEEYAPRSPVKRKRFKAKREAERKRRTVGLILGVAAAVILLPLLVLGAVVLGFQISQPESLAAANTPPEGSVTPVSKGGGSGRGEGDQDGQRQGPIAGRVGGNPAPPAANTANPPGKIPPPPGAAASRPGTTGPVAGRPPPTPPPAVAQGPSEEPAVGKPAPEIDGEDLDGQCFLLSDYRGSVVLLDFWGFW